MLFQRLFNFRPDEIKLAERRLRNRYRVSPAFPLTATLSTGDHRHRGAVVDISATGLGLVTEQPPAAEPAGPARLALTLEGFEMSALAEVRHIRPAASGFHCGLNLGFDRPESRMAYLQLLMPIAIGSTQAATSPSRAQLSEPEFDKLSFEGESFSKLTVWCRREPPGTPESFEFQVEEYFVRGKAADRELHAFSLVDDDRPHRARDTAPLFQISSRLETEIKQLFRWSVMNLPDSVPGPVREFLRGFVGW